MLQLRDDTPIWMVWNVLETSDEDGHVTYAGMTQDFDARTGELLNEDGYIAQMRLE